MQSVIGTFTTWLKQLLNAVLLLLPDSPFVFLESQQLPDAVTNIMPYLNWFFGISTLAYILTLWLAAVLIFYVYQAILRWVKAIQ